jgi:DNA-binding NtrC family response regulator
VHHILYVDDDPGMRALLARVLAFDFQVTIASGAREAMNILQGREVPFDVVITDMTMRDGNGIDLLEYLRHFSPSTARILFSGDYRIQSEPGVFTECDPFRVLIKPVANKVVTDAVHAAIQWQSATAGQALAA